MVRIMISPVLFTRCIFFACNLSFFIALAQSPFQFNISTAAEVCSNGSATIEVLGASENDSLFISWSNGEKSNGRQKTHNVSNLSTGEQMVSVKIKYKKDTVINYFETTLSFFVAKELCKVTVSNYFTPNGDDYNDFLSLVNVHKHPNFELRVFNKWGQQVHHQSNTYVPWDGKWLGVNLPEGVYYYVFLYDANNKKLFERGDVTIIR